MSKKIVILLDGTSDVQENNTNINKLNHLIKQDENQIVKYFTGIATHPNKIRDAIEDATGLHISSKITHAYASIAEVYDQGDEIFIFGFSRGAYEARALASLINYVGIINRKKAGKDGLRRMAEIAYGFYLTKRNKVSKVGEKVFEIVETVKNSHCVTFLGVFDTVAALGFPLENKDAEKFDKEIYRFFDTELNENVLNAYHALAVDEHRFAFEPVLWTKHSPNTKMEQVWFAGCHQDIGGGYPDNDKLSRIPLKWMIDKAQRVGLEFVEEFEIAKDDFSAVLHDSYAAFKKEVMLPQLYGTPVLRAMLDPLYTDQFVHSSVAMRRQDQSLNYAPDNPTYIDRTKFPLKDINLEEFIRVKES